jgi:hypothetical protein
MLLLVATSHQTKQGYTKLVDKKMLGHMFENRRAEQSSRTQGLTTASRFFSPTFRARPWQFAGHLPADTLSTSGWFLFL